ncbi:non-hydrolyzing UDP-N-acetylglucosamine 2-epimerase [Pelagibius marinus]|uniref:non-hydrolyzing UDP-N-acetylglucosamine 2-epimerase n=1 Tax=Pelagibius marinus TaxID=2762760 RepID=UPI00187323EE|nr:UDP-N-acetylglucosamine 2-epimerase (non-hydrolyzing) [Pelagibius marinus]
MIRQNIHLIVAARPNFMKVAPLYHVLKRQDWCRAELVHTGQHYDANMSDTFFSDLGLPPPDYHLGVGSGSHAEQTGAVMVAYEEICLRHRPDWTVVVGDVNSTLACALVAAKLCIALAHLEAGLRSGDRTMPEEINRIVTDRLADLLWTPSSDGNDNLKAEGISGERIELVGNIMIDAFELQRPQIDSLCVAERFGVERGRYGIVTLHRPSNVDDRSSLAQIIDVLIATSHRLPLVFAVHPRTRARLHDFGLDAALARQDGIRLSEPLRYNEFMNLACGARLAITDSGGIQEETTYLNIPCLTLRPNTERPITITQGTNRLVRPDTLAEMVDQALTGGLRTTRHPALWDGKTAARVAESLFRHSGRDLTRTCA